MPDKCLSVRKSTAQEAKNQNETVKNRMIIVLMMIIILFFWYIGLNQIYYYILDVNGYTLINTFYQAILSVASSLIYTYLIYEVIKIDKFSLRNSLILTIGMVIFSISMLFIIPLDFN